MEQPAAKQTVQQAPMVTPQVLLLLQQAAQGSFENSFAHEVFLLHPRVTLVAQQPRMGLVGEQVKHQLQPPTVLSWLQPATMTLSKAYASHANRHVHANTASPCAEYVSNLSSPRVVRLTLATLADTEPNRLQAR